MQRDDDQPPFAVPADYDLERALRAPLPRAVPDSLRNHPSKKAIRATHRKVWGIMVILAVLGFVLRDTTPMRNLGLYITPLAYLEWVAPIAGLLALIVLIDWHPWKKDPYRYLREGVTVVGQVVDLRMEVTTRVNGQDTNWAYDVYFQALHPSTGQPTVFCLRSPQFDANRPNLKCRVGDWVTAVYLPGDLDSMTLYGFTDADPDHSLLETKPAGSAGLALLGLLGGIVGCGWILSTYALAEVNKSFLLAVCVPGCVLGSVIGFIQLRKIRQRHEAEQAQAFANGMPVMGETYRPGHVYGGALLGAFMGCLVMAVLLVGLNGALDRSKGVVEPVEVVETWVTTHQAIFNSYEVEYVDPKTGQREKIGVSPLELMQEGDLAAERVTHQGALGWPRQTMRIVVLPEGG